MNLQQIRDQIESLIKMMSKYATNDDLKKLENLLQLLSQKVDKHTTDIKTLYDLIKMV